ncbi:MAG: MFS transporter [Clostridia bacterium]|nr:MFS transporter [Clostridia bacterium]
MIEKTAEGKRSDRSSDIRLLIACALLYIFYIAAKNVYAVEIVEVMRRFDVPKSVASLASSAAFFTYGVTQFFLAGLVPKMNIGRYIIVVVPVSGVLFSLTPFCTAIWQLVVLYAITGCLLAEVYPLCIYVVGKYLSDDLVSIGDRLLGVGLSVGFLLDYLGCSLLVKYYDWRPAFWIFSGLMIFGAVFFFVAFGISMKNAVSSDASPAGNQNSVSGSESGIRGHLGFIAFVCSLGFVSNFLYYAITGWVTAILCDVFEVSSSQSIFLTVFVPIVAMFGPLVEVHFCEKKSYWTVLIAFCLASLIPMVVLSFLFKINLVLTLIPMVVYTAIMRGITTIVGIDLPLKTKDLINAGTLGSIINAVSCIGVSAGPPVMGAVIDVLGQRAFFIVTGALVILLTLLAFIGMKLFKSKR